MVSLKIDPEFRDKIPPLTDAEFEQLRENILSDGEVYEPIVTWNDTIVDGHNRWKIICENWDLLENKFRTKPMEFADKWDAFEWMYRKQLGRRNLTEAQRAYMIGKMYEARKNTAAFKGNQYSNKNGDGQNVRHQSRREIKEGTAGKIGKDIGVDGRTVRRNADFANGVDALHAVSEAAAAKVLQGDSGVSKKTVMDIPKMSVEDIESLASEIVSGTIKDNRSGSQRRGFTKADRELRESVNRIVADMYDASTVPEYTAEDLVIDIQNNAKEFVSTIRSILQERSTVLTDEARLLVAEAITRELIDEFTKVRDILV